MSVYRMYDVRKYIKIDLNKNFIISVMVMIPIIFVCYYINNLYLNIVMILLVLIYAWLINKKSVNLIINMENGKFLKKGAQNG